MEFLKRVHPSSARSEDKWEKRKARTTRFSIGNKRARDFGFGLGKDGRASWEKFTF